MKKSIKVAFAGNPNVGKTTLLNHLAGTNLSVGNWPGVTVEKREGFLSYKDYDIHFIDLPGIYTLEPLSEDEWIARNFLIEEDPDVIVNVIETTNADRDFLLTTELLEFGKPMVLAFNMSDEASRRGIEVDAVHTVELLDIPAVKTNGRNGEGVDELLDSIISASDRNHPPKPVVYGERVENALRAIEAGKGNGRIDKHALLELLSGNDAGIEQKVDLEKFYRNKIGNIISDERYAYANGLHQEILRKKKMSSRDVTDKLDKVLLHPIFGFLIFLAVMFLLFKISFDFSTPLMTWTQNLITGFLGPLAASALTSLGAGKWVLGFFSQAIVGGVGFVVTFVPLIATIYLVLAYLEMSGYMPRIAFLMDRFMHKLGLHGKGIIPLLLGFGCNVPAVMATRTLESKKDKLLVMTMIPFMSCPARLVVFSFFAIMFFPHPAVVIFALYLLGIIIGLITAFFLRKTAFRGKLSHFVMELPPYRVPRTKTVLKIVWVQVKNFLARAGTVIFAASVVVWVLLNTPPGLKNQSDSAAAYIGRAITPVLEPIGIKDWRISTSLIPAFLAREIVLSSMGTIYSAEVPQTGKEIEFWPALKSQIEGLGSAIEESVVSLFSPTITSLQADSENQNLVSVIRSSFTPASALSFMIFLLLYTSCLATVAVMAREAGNKFAIGFLGYSLVIAWVVAFAVYHIGSII